MAAQDPEELFDLCDRDGQPLGRSLPRSVVHREGHWHRSLHVWVVLRIERTPWVVFQRRSLGKDTFPGCMDVSVAGHLRAGEGIAEGLREADEELGLALTLANVTLVGTRRKVEDRAPAFIDREVQSIFVTVLDVPVTSLRPDPEELDGVVVVPLMSAEAVCDGRVAQVDGLAWRTEWTAPARGVLETSALVQVTDGYYARSMEALRALTSGRTVVPFAIG